MSLQILLLIGLPIVSGILVLFFREESLRQRISLLTLLITLFTSIVSFIRPPLDSTVNIIEEYTLVLGVNKLSATILIFVNLFGLLVFLYSKNYSVTKKYRGYFSYLIWLVAFSNLICFAKDFIIFLFAWGATLALLYFLLNLGSGQSANKALSIVGTSDFALMLGICLYISSTRTIIMPDSVRIALDTPLHWFSFILMLAGAFAKAGCGPLHTWIPTASQDAPLPVMAILPASLDKLLGIYLLARICTNFFMLNDLALALLLFTGGLTIVFAVMMALIQHDLRKLLSYHAISQVGYMVLGFGTGTVLGVAGGIFHMLNHAIYKSGLFLTGASVGQKRNTFELNKLGMLAKVMPVTFITALIFSLSISGVPPFNGFSSKWLIYQGVIQGLFVTPNKFLGLVYIFALLSAMFGSILTLASFIKFIHAIFLGEDNAATEDKNKDVAKSMLFAVSVLAGLCVLFGVIPNMVLNGFIRPWLGEEIRYLGTWNSVLAFFWLFSGLIIGVIFWKKNGYPGSVRADSVFIGGEDPVFKPSYPATEFYRTIENSPFIRKAFITLKSETLDFYNILNLSLRTISYFVYVFIDRLINVVTVFSGRTVLGFSWVLRRVHSGVLDTYLVWCVFGLLAMFFVFLGR